jgi:glycosyltransferase involved in cell wall biosynthesis
MKKITLVMITKNAADTLEMSLKSVRELVNEIVIVDDFSTDKTTEIAQKYTDKIKKNHQKSLGHQKSIALSMAKEDWILSLDSDEIVSEKLKKEIIKLLSQDKIQYDGFLIPYQNHFLGKKISYGGESYKML